MEKIFLIGFYSSYFIVDHKLGFFTTREAAQKAVDRKKEEENNLPPNIRVNWEYIEVEKGF